MSASIKSLSLDEFLAWERAQPLRYEFDGVQPVGMTGGSTRHALLIARLTTAVGSRIRPPCEVYASELKVITAGRVRYPDLSIVCGTPDEAADDVKPTIVFEVLSPSTALVDRRVKSTDYRSVDTIRAYVIVSQDQPEVIVLRRSTGWLEEIVFGATDSLQLSEVGIAIPLSELYQTRRSETG